MESVETTTLSTPRQQGRHAGLDRRRIAEAARSLGPHALSIQAVADLLGVDRKAVNYHVTNLAGLLELVAVDAFRMNFANVDLSSITDWKEACRAYAFALHDSLVTTGALVSYFRFQDSGDLTMLGPADIVMQRLYEAGFTDEQVGNAVILIVNVAMSAARDDVMVIGTNGTHPQLPIILGALRDAYPRQFPGLQRAMTATPAREPYGPAQLEASIDIVTRGLESLLPVSAPSSKQI
ncbi:TetR/AcrR family transcriptional regulator [Herbiconiux ginsengi]|uniref:Transcriptional regulator, TetR family n=1 Tax=Herbiconiux ginsengi TaxID=381665 RepID=A0A1H3TGY4_9MICO|nr:hypothetical protein [Herbiconiux ginsengi]SDZ49504.1 transcriptional regulator, TetR family [Herbiconiux ginsengi]